MRKYEAFVILHPRLSQDEVKVEVEKFSDLLKKNGANNLSADNWGRREISYKTQRQHVKNGYYILYKFETENNAIVEELQRVCRIADTVIKFQTNLVSDRKRKYQGNLKFINPDVNAASLERRPAYSMSGFGMEDQY